MMIKDWIEAMRPRTLPVSVAGVVTAVGLAAYDGFFSVTPALLCFLFALLAQIVSNFANEYYDFKRGADKKGRVGPRRGVTEGTIKPKAMRNATFATLAVACVIGCCLIPFGGWAMVPVGIFIAVFAIAYSAGPYPLSRHGLGDIAVLCFFGIVPINFTYYLQAHSFTLNVFLASITIGLLAVNVLLVNNYRDIDDDREAGKHTTVVIFGRKWASHIYLANGYIAMLLMLSYWGENIYSFVCPATYLVMHTRTYQQIITSQGVALNPLLGATARNMLIFALLLLLFTAI
ncbi:MAG: 1,4-dihydroxy-2-naphthoate octaprenyltransferase [Muribaculaceae bacterium]|nr:1,4-dihydroxy-2-naphthoate octaprenyltransferase [Muribaculaceae bacterium]